MEETIFEQFPDREIFERYWKEHYVPVEYADVKHIFEDFVKTAEGHIYISDYEEKRCISKADFKENLSQEAQFMFEDGLTEIFYEKNPELYETAFAIYEEARITENGKADIAAIFHDTYHQLYTAFLDQLFDEVLA